MGRISAENLREAVSKWNATENAYPENQTVVQLFEEQTASTPDRIALIFENQTLTYKELNEKANQLAHNIKNVEPDQLIGVYLEKSPALIIAILAILKSGAGFLPLNIYSPKKYLDFILRDSRTHTIIAGENLEKNISTVKNIMVLDQQGNILKPTDIVTQTTNLSPNAKPDDLAYAMYVSDKSGKPKAVLINHYSLVNYLYWIKDTLPFTPKDKFSLLQPIFLNYVITEIFTPLMIGASLVITEEHLEKSPARIIELIKQNRITVIQQTPQGLKVLMDEDLLASCPSVKTIIVSSEPLTFDIYKLFSNLKNINLYAMYGTTETTIHAAYYKYHDMAENIFSPIIGNPIYNTQCYLLDENLQLVNVGDVGELYIGGLGVAREYLNRAELTVDSFIENPFRTDEESKKGINKRLYRTGDFGRYHIDGNIEFIGRKDTQVKVNGIRIDLQEIERNLRNCTDVKEALVTIREDNPGDKRIVAYIIPNLSTMRIPYHAKVEVEINGELIEVEAEDLSVEGICIKELPADLSMNHIIQIHLPQKYAEKPLILTGQLVWQMPPLTGIHFYLTLEQKALMHRQYDALRTLPDGSKLNCPTILSHRNLRYSLQQVLPDYMVHSAAVWLEAFPRKSNGEIDIAALPQPNYALREKRYVAPRNATERFISDIMYELFNIKNISVDDSFLEMGGQSLIATQLVSRLNKEYHIELDLNEIFKNPTVGKIADAIESRMGQKDYVPLVHKTRQKLMPLSFAEQRLWFIEQLKPDTSIYNVPLAFHIYGKIDLALLETSFNILIDRHESLRTIYIEHDGIPYRNIFPELQVHITTFDLTKTAIERQKTEAEEIRRHEAQRPFHLDSAPLMRLTLIRYSNQDTLLLIVMHRIISDGWSNSILLKELSKIYNGLFKDELPELKSLPIQYADFAIWQKEYLSSDRIEKELNYWQNVLNEAPSLINLPTDFPRPAVIGNKSLTIFFTLPTKLTKQIKQHVANEKVTLFMFLLASLQILFYRHTDETDILIGTQIANRNREEVENIIGSFVNTLVIRGDLSGNPSFNDFLQKIRDITLMAYDHQNIPFERLLDHLNIEHNLSHSPLFQIMFDLKIPDEKLLTFDETIAKPEFITNSSTLYDLAISVTERPENLYIEIKYNAELFKSNSIEKLFSHWENLLHSIISNPEAKLSELPLLFEDETHHLLYDLNKTEHDYLSTANIPQLFTMQVKKTPDHIAVIDHDKTLTYKELDEISNQIAHYLQTIGTTPGNNVAVCVERNIILPAILLGILKAGCAYVPMDPSYPNERLEGIFEDSNSQTLITQKNLNKIFKPKHHVIFMDDDWNKILKEKITPLNLEISHETTAYIIYTSGSTGKPKGVMISHKNASNLLAWGHMLYSEKELKCALASTSINFDISVFEIFVPLTEGGAIVIAANLLEINDWFDHEITIINAVPSVIKSLLELGLELPKSVQTINLGGEPLQQSLVQALYALPQIKKVYNLYGPSETTTYSTVSLMKKTGNELITIGKPIANTQIYLLDRYMNPVPLGCTGEIYIAGDGVTTGYLNHPELTKERFLPNPFKDSTSQQSTNNRLYKTGDLARFKNNGNIEYIGRNDFQVKIHGFRIELGEIEQVIARYPAINECIAIVREDIPDTKIIVAYLILKPNTSIDTLNTYLSEKLPAFMIPKSFIVLNQFPQTPTGKIDRNALPSPKQHLAREKFSAPQTEVQKKLTEVWRNILQIDDIGIHDNFFEIGGHSLLIAQLAYHIREIYHYKLSFIQFFSNPTIAVLASLIERKTIKNHVTITTLDLIKKDLSTARAIKLTHTVLIPAEKPVNILLTGVSGFLGIHLLAQLLENTDATIYCLMRKNKDKSLQQIFAHHAAQYHLEKLIDNPRIVLTPGDIAKTQLGLNDKDWKDLSNKIDSIYHAAAYVHHLYDYATLRETNVLGTIELLKFTATSKNKRFYYISTIWAALDKDLNNRVLEQFPKHNPTGIEDGYCLTKWTSEKILSEAKDRGFTVMIFRPSFILGHSETGLIPTKNLHILLLLKGCLQMGYAPKGLGVLDSLPVNFVAKAVVEISLRGEDQNKVFNCCHPKPPRLEEVFHWLHNSGFPLKLLPYKEWRDEHLANITGENALYPIAALYLSEQEPTLSMPCIVTNNMKKSLHALNISYPEVDHLLFTKYFEFLENWFRQ